MKKVDGCTVVDLFSGAGGLTHGFIMEGFSVSAGIDADASCRYPYEANNVGAQFIHNRIQDVSTEEISELFPSEHTRILVGCAPCQPFSSYTRKKGEHENWSLLREFSRLITAVRPDIISMENVPRLVTYRDGTIFNDFVSVLQKHGYAVSVYPAVNAPDFGIPQNRMRLILFASKWGPIDILRPSHTPDRYRTVRQTINFLPPITSGETHPGDPLHRSSRLSELNLRRIRASIPGGTWLDWDDELRSSCHTKDSGKFYKSVYGRMAWDEPAPTVTTQCNGYGNGRFGHPEQDRAISLREAALLQTFPRNYKFFDPASPYRISTTSRMIGNAIPVALARVIAKSIRLHIKRHRGWLTRPGCR